MVVQTDQSTENTNSAKKIVDVSMLVWPMQVYAANALLKEVSSNDIVALIIGDEEVVSSIKIWAKIKNIEIPDERKIDSKTMIFLKKP